MASGRLFTSGEHRPDCEKKAANVYRPCTVSRLPQNGEANRSTVSGPPAPVMAPRRAKWLPMGRRRGGRRNSELPNEAVVGHRNGSGIVDRFSGSTLIRRRTGGTASRVKMQVPLSYCGRWINRHGPSSEVADANPTHSNTGSAISSQMVISGSPVEQGFAAEKKPLRGRRSGSRPAPRPWATPPGRCSRRN